MKKTTVFVLMLSLICLVSAPLFAAEDGAALYKAKCAACHGPDGKKMAKADLSATDVQAKADADLLKFVSENPKHNFKTKGVNDEQIKAIVAFLRTLKK
jgi:mono/diheme cytochrome c family protein